MRVGSDEVEPSELLGLCDGRNWLFDQRGQSRVSCATKGPIALTAAIVIDDTRRFPCFVNTQESLAQAQLTSNALEQSKAAGEAKTSCGAEPEPQPPCSPPGRIPDFRRCGTSSPEAKHLALPSLRRWRPSIGAGETRLALRLLRPTVFVLAAPDISVYKSLFRARSILYVLYTTYLRLRPLLSAVSVFSRYAAFPIRHDSFSAYLALTLRSCMSLGSALHSSLTDVRYSLGLPLFH